jgi:hypothetical protein
MSKDKNRPATSNDGPPVRVSSSGVGYVKAADILRSPAGQREIRRTVESGVYQQKASKAQTQGA